MVAVTEIRGAKFTLGILNQNHLVPPENDKLSKWLISKSFFDKMPTEFKEVHCGSGTNEEMFKTLPYVIVKMMQAKSKATMHISRNAMALEQLSAEFIDLAHFEECTPQFSEETVAKIVSNAVLSEMRTEIALYDAKVLNHPCFVKNPTILYAHWEIVGVGSASDKEAAYIIHVAETIEYHHIVSTLLPKHTLERIKTLLGR